ncbi:hypothetical protein DL95DRAFT_385495 [Leptodontidium sp. 2 PMI_412]|nr:hypothetical protein DL95DRAFT_385495 [Leptodontidium sp. 2 PMI_412]
MKSRRASVYAQWQRIQHPRSNPRNTCMYASWLNLILTPNSPSFPSQPIHPFHTSILQSFTQIPPSFEMSATNSS